MDVTLLGIETSCDDTAAAVLHNGNILSNIFTSQNVHTQYGGVVPELASRAHQSNIIPVVEQALNTAKIKLSQVSAIAFTQGPGLLGSLLVGTSYAKGLSLGLNVPLIAVHHVQAHILAHFIPSLKKDGSSKEKPQFPFLCLTVSGGHTQIVLVKDYLDMEVLGQTIDDAAGEAFDKSAKMMGLPYPGGPLIDKFAQTGNAEAFHFAEPVIKNYDFSFSGFKTSVLYFLQHKQKQNPDFIKENLNDLCASIQKTICTLLLNKVIKASVQTGIKEIALAGGVSANSYLRNIFMNTAKEKKWKIYIPEMEYCTDNAAMIAITGYYKYLKGEFAGKNIIPLANIPNLK